MVDKLTEVLYRIQKSARHATFVVHHNKLKPALLRMPDNTAWAFARPEPKEIGPSERETQGSDKIPVVKRLPERFGDWYYEK